MGGVAHALVHPALARSNSDTLLRAQAVERNGDLWAVAAADAIGNNVDAVTQVAKVKGRLGDADVALDAHQGDGGGIFLGEGVKDGRDGHGEARLVVGGRGEEGLEWLDGGTELGDGLGGGVDGDGELVGEVDELLGGEDAWGWESK